MAEVKNRGGRPKGAGSYARDDDVLVDEMIRLMDSGECVSRTAAAYAVVEKARGKGTRESLVRRLLARCAVKDVGRYDLVE